MVRIGSPVVRSLAVAALAAAVALPASPVLAAKCAKPGGGGGCFATIQEAVDAAGAGETVFVRPGGYMSSVTIPPGKDGLVLAGTGRKPSAVHLDADALITPGIVIQSSSVTVRNLSVRGAQTGVFSTGAGTVVSRVQVFAARGPCILISGDGAAVLSTRVKGCSGHGVLIGGDDALVRGVTAAQSAGIVITGRRGRVIASRVFNSEGVGISVTGDSPQVRDCQVRGAIGTGIVLSGDALPPAVSRALRNSVRGALGGGVLLIGSGSKVLAGNKVQGAVGTGVGLSCTSQCSGDRVRANTVSGLLDGTASYQVLAGGKGVLVIGNRAADGNRLGFYVPAPGAEVRDNLAVNCGTPNSAGFLVTGDGSTLRRNVARAGAGAGFQIGGGLTTLVNNLAIGNSRHGFAVGNLVPATGTVLDGNRAVGNQDYGFHLALSASGATVTNNVARGNSYSPFCDQPGATTVFSGNSFTDSSCFH